MRIAKFFCDFNNSEKLSTRTEMNLWFSTNVNKKLIKMKFAANFSSFHSILSLLFLNGARARVLLLMSDNDEKCNNSYLKNLPDCYQLHTSAAIL